MVREEDPRPGREGGGEVSRSALDFLHAYPFCNWHHHDWPEEEWEVLAEDLEAWATERNQMNTTSGFDVSTGLHTVPALCDGCGHDLRSPDHRSTTMAAHITVDESDGFCVPRHIPKVYKICWSCWLEAHGIKPNKEKN